MATVLLVLSSGVRNRRHDRILAGQSCRLNRLTKGGRSQTTASQVDIARELTNGSERALSMVSIIISVWRVLVGGNMPTPISNLRWLKFYLIGPQIRWKASVVGSSPISVMR